MRFSLGSETSQHPQPISVVGHLLNRSSVRAEASAPSTCNFSFETDVMQPQVGHVPVFGHVTDAPFIDIGIPSEFARAQALFA